MSSIRSRLHRPRLQDVSAALAHQNPKVKENTLIWLAGCVPRETKAAAVKLVAGVVPAATKCTDEGAPSIREAAFNFLVQLALKVNNAFNTRCVVLCACHPHTEIS
jgi:hypothetical protein